MYGPARLEFDYEDPVPEDRELAAREMEAKAATAKALIEAGAYGPEVLEAIGLPAVAFGQPGADPDKELLIDLVKGAPAHLAELILPLLGFDLPKKPPAPATGQPPPAGDEPEDPEPVARTPFEQARDALLAAVPEIEAAQRWVAKAVIDDDTCQPCRDNDGKTYRNRADAYEDYPGGSGYVHCVGEKYGNECRCRVVKRRKGNDGEDSGDE